MKFKKKSISEVRKMTKAGLMEYRAKIAERRSEILDELENDNKDLSEERELTEDEIAELEDLRNQQAIIQARIDELESKAVKQAEEDREVDTNEEGEDGITDPEQRMVRVKVGEIRSFRNPITQLLRGAMSGELNSELRGLSEMGRKAQAKANLGVNTTGVYIPMELRGDLQATVAKQGIETVGTDILNILDPIRDNLVVAKAGATILTGLVGNLDIPSYSGSTASWEGEISKAKDGAGTFSSKKLTPKRLATTINVSKQLLLQDSAGVEAMLKRDIVASIYTKLEQTMFSNKAASGAVPRGLFKAKTQGAAVKDYAGLVDLYAKLRNNLYSGEGIKAVVNPTGYAILAKTPIMANVAQGFLVDGNKLATGTEVLQTTAVEGGIMMADFSQLFVGQWGALEVKIDDTTRFDEGLVRIMVNSYWDYDFRDDNAFEVAPITAGSPA